MYVCLYLRSLKYTYFYKWEMFGMKWKRKSSTHVTDNIKNISELIVSACNMIHNDNDILPIST